MYIIMADTEARGHLAGDGRAGVLDSGLSDSTAHVLSVTPHCRWRVRRTGCKWKSSRYAFAEKPRRFWRRLACHPRSALLPWLGCGGQRESSWEPGEEGQGTTEGHCQRSPSPALAGRDRPADIDVLACSRTLLWVPVHIYNDPSLSSTPSQPGEGPSVICQSAQLLPKQVSSQRSLSSHCVVESSRGGGFRRVQPQRRLRHSSVVLQGVLAGDR